MVMYLHYFVNAIALHLFRQHANNLLDRTTR